MSIAFFVLKKTSCEKIRKFCIENYGGFDRCATSAIIEVKKTYTHIKLVLVLPYMTKAVSDHKEEYCKKYDEIVIADMLEKTPARLRIIKANEYMVDSCDFLVCNVEHSWGGATKTMKYARRKGKSVRNLVEK